MFGCIEALPIFALVTVRILNDISHLNRYGVSRRLLLPVTSCLLPLFLYFSHPPQHPLSFSPHRLSLLVPPCLHLTDYSMAIILLSRRRFSQLILSNFIIESGGGGEALRIAHINIRSLVPHFPSIIDLFMWVWYTRDQRNLAERGRLRVALNIDNYHFIHCQIYNIDRFIGNRDGGIALYIITCRAHPLISLSLQLIFLSM